MVEDWARLVAVQASHPSRNAAEELSLSAEDSDHLRGVVIEQRAQATARRELHQQGDTLWRVPLP